MHFNSNQPSTMAIYNHVCTESDILAMQFTKLDVAILRIPIKDFE